MGRNLNEIISHSDEDLLRRFEVLDKLPESEVRAVAKIAHANLKEFHIIFCEMEKYKDSLIESLNVHIRELEMNIEERNKKLRRMFDI
jgi:hypothetical protein